MFLYVYTNYHFPRIRGRYPDPPVMSQTLGLLRKTVDVPEISPDYQPRTAGTNGRIGM